MSTKSNGVKSSLPAEYYDNPALYGLRRSTRAHNPPERFQIEEEAASSRRSTRAKDSSIDADSEDDDDSLEMMKTTLMSCLLRLDGERENLNLNLKVPKEQKQMNHLNICKTHIKTE